MEPVTVSFALTRSDWIRAASARLKMRFTKGERAAIRAAGGVMLACACAFFVLRPGMQPLTAGLTVCGTFFLFLCFPTMEAAAKNRAAAGFDSGQCGVAAQSVAFGGDGVKIDSERYTAEIPYAMLCEAYADEETILLCTGIGECRCVPKRAMSPDEQKRAESLLAEAMKKKFKQEGAREWTK